MVSMMWGYVGASDVPQDEEVVRSTTANYDAGKPAAMQRDLPAMGDVEVDVDPTLGLANRSLASPWTQGQKYAPGWAANVDQQAVNSVRIDGQVSSSGTAAAREMAGQFGHGSMSYAIGIEPTAGLVDGTRMTNEYFAIDKPPIQLGAGSYMEPPPGYSHGQVAASGRQGADNARVANMSSLYDTYMRGNG